MTATPASTQGTSDTPRWKTLAGAVERITYRNEETGYTVARLLPERGSEAAGDGDGGLVTVVGDAAGLTPGEAVELDGVWKTHPRHGWQFEVRGYRTRLPATEQGIRRYLGSGLIKGVGPKTAERIVGLFGTDTLDVLERAPGRLREVRGLGPRRAGLIAEAWGRQRAIKEVMLFLQGHGVSTSLAVRIYKQYGDASIEVARGDPYRMARDVWGIGFKTADKIARALGFRADDPKRLQAGALFALSDASDSGGHTYLPRAALAALAAELLEADAAAVERAIDALLADGGLRAEDLGETEAPDAGAAPALREPRPEYAEGRAASDAVYLPPFYAAEQGVANGLRRLLGARPEQDKLGDLAGIDHARMFAYLQEREGLGLTERQREGVVAALTRHVAVLTGGPGTGKSYSMRALIRALTLKRKRVVLAAPTGRAAKRLTDATGLEAKTLHRLLALRPGAKPRYDGESPLPADVVVVDETSMLDTLVMNSLVKAVATGAHLLLVGDADQLPSVGAGNVLRDIIASGIVPVVRLDRIFRQGEGSAIAANAHRINGGEMPRTGREIADFFVFAEDDPERAGELVVDLVARRVPRRFGLSPGEIQVLAPGHAGPCGVGALNERLQAALNPPAPGTPEKAYGNRLFRPGDRVLQLRNDYDKDVYNGDGGVVAGLSEEERELRVRLEDGRELAYDYGELDELALAYAMSVHKAQGSEYPACVIPLTMSHYMLLERKLLYTAVTRARKLVVLVGSRKALGIAVRGGPRAGREDRHTGLAARLRAMTH